MNSAFISEKSKAAQNEKWKKQLCVFVYVKYVWQILKSLTGTFRRAQTLKLGVVSTTLAHFFHHDSS